jgi:hypothetical protein
MIEKTYCHNQEWEVDFEEVAPGIYVYHNAIIEELDVVNRIETGLAKDGTRFAWKSAYLSYDRQDDESRKCKDFKIKNDGMLGPRDDDSEDFCLLYEQFIDIVKICMSHYLQKHSLNYIDYYECINIVRYGKGEFFKVHTDDGEAYRCTVSVVGYPNDDYEGGELTFPKFDLTYKPKAGDVVLFPSSFIYEHSAEPVTDDGFKYSLVLMTDRNEFAHRNESPTYHPKDVTNKYGTKRA